MRKPRKGKAADAAVPSPQPTSTVKLTKHIKRPCLNCREVPAKPLDILGYPDPDVIFCTTICASIYAINYVWNSPITWCTEHKRWTNTNGYCPDCIEQRELARPDGCIVEMPAAGDEGTVNHVN